MSIGDCPHWPECGHKSHGACDATGPGDAREPKALNWDAQACTSCGYIHSPSELCDMPTKAKSFAVFYADMQQHFRSWYKLNNRRDAMMIRAGKQVHPIRKHRPL